VEQGTYDDHTRQVPADTILSIIHMDPLPGRMVLEISPETGFMLVDRLLGGPGRPLAHTRTITDIEVALLKGLITSLVEDIRAGWLNVVDTSPRLAEIVLNAHLAQITFPTDAVMVITFEVKIGDTSGTMTFCLPYTTLEPITPQLNARLVFSEPTKAQRSDHAQAMQRSLKTVQVPVIAQLGTAGVQIRDLLNLQVGDVLRLDSSVGGGIRIAVGGKPRFIGSPGLRGSRLAVQILAVIGDVPPQGE
jgi:flagellar motor switch protein FliM